VAIALLEKENSLSWSYQIALIHAHRCDMERAFACHGSALRCRDTGLLGIKGDPLETARVRLTVQDLGA